MLHEDGIVREGFFNSPLSLFKEQPLNSQYIIVIKKKKTATFSHFSSLSQFLSTLVKTHVLELVKPSKTTN